MAAASSSSFPAGNSNRLNDGTIPGNNSNDCNNRRRCCDQNDNTRNAANVTFYMTADGSDTSRSAARPTPLVTENSIRRPTANYSPRRHLTATSTSSPLRKKKNAVVQSRSYKKSSKKQPLGKMWIRHVPISAKPHSNYYDYHNKRGNSHSNTNGSNTILGRSRIDRRDSTDSFASTSLFLVSPASDSSSSPSRSSLVKDSRDQSIFVDSILPMSLPLLHPYSQPQPRSQPKYYYRRPHTLRSSAAVHAFGESGKPLSSSLTPSSSTSPSPSPSTSSASSPSFWKDCSHDYIMHEDDLLV